MKKVCFVIPRAYYLFNPDTEGAKDKVGGAQLQSYLLSTELAKDNSFDVHFCMANFGQAEIETRENVTLWNAFDFNESIFKRTQKLFKTLKKINADIFIFRSADVGVAIAILFIKRFLKKRVLYMLAADAETTHKRLLTHSGRLTAFFMKIAYKKVDIITAQTKQQSNIFEKDRNRKPNLILKNIYLQPDRIIDHTIKQTTLWVGRLDKIKNPYIYLRLASVFPQESFLMIAPVVRDFIDYGKKVQEDAKKINNLTLIDFVNPKDIREYYEKAKIYVITSELEGFSNTTAEAMQAECPVLSYNVNPDNILNQYRCGFCANHDFHEFVNSFKNLIQDSELRISMGKNGSRYIDENHKKEELINAFKQLLVNE